MHVDYLANHPQLLREVAELHFAQWPTHQAGASLESDIALLSVCCTRNAIPSAVVALHEGSLCGFALLISDDFDLRPDLSPWLASVYVKPTHRRSGVASALVARIETETAALKIPTLYLYTAAFEALYARLGWQVLQRYVYKERDHVVMVKQLTSPKPTVIDV